MERARSIASVFALYCIALHLREFRGKGDEMKGGSVIYVG